MNLHMTRVSVIALVALTGGAALAQSDNGQTFCDTGYMNADANSDGVIDRQELQQVTEAEFSELDANEDGNISRSEYSDCLKSWTQRASNSEPMTDEDFSAMDSNQDGSIDQDEYMQAADRAYAARWGEPGAGKQVRDADVVPATPDNQGGVGDAQDATDGESQSGAASEDDTTDTQAGDDQSDTSGGDQASASDSATDEAASDTQQGQPQLILRRIILVPADDMRSPDDMGRDEIAHRAALRFLLLDANRDRRIDPEEQQGGGADQASLEDQANEQFDRADTDKSGDLSRDEYAADMEARWQQAQSRGQGSESSLR